jgi:hypothetical protein
VDVPAGVPLVVPPPEPLPEPLPEPPLEPALPPELLPEELPPPQPLKITIPISTAIIRCCVTDKRVRPRTANGSNTTASVTPPGSHGEPGVPCDAGSIAAVVVRAVVVIVSVEFAALPFRVTDAGAKLQLAP